MKTGQWESFIHNMLSHDTTIVLRVTHSTHIHSAISWLIYFVIVFLLFDRKLTLASLLCKPFQYSLIELRILRCEASHRLPFRWQFNLAIKKVCLIFLQRWTMDSLMPYSPAISELFLTASASATILSLNARLYDMWWALGMMTTWLKINDCQHEIVW